MKPPRKLGVTPLIVVFWDQPMWHGTPRVFTDRVDDLKAELCGLYPLFHDDLRGPGLHEKRGRDVAGLLAGALFRREGV